MAITAYEWRIHADYGIVGDWNEYLPAVVQAIKPVLAERGLG